jgi:hypothetical protein
LLKQLNLACVLVQALQHGRLLLLPLLQQQLLPALPLLPHLLLLQPVQQLLQRCCA